MADVNAPVGDVFNLHGGSQKDLIDLGSIKVVKMDNSK